MVLEFNKNSVDPGACLKNTSVPILSPGNCASMFGPGKCAPVYRPGNWFPVSSPGSLCLYWALKFWA